MKLDNRIESFVKLGELLKKNLSKSDKANQLHLAIKEASKKNTWFIETNINYAISYISNVLTQENISKWLSVYPYLTKEKTPKTIGVVMAGNIPLVGFHDLLCVLLSGNKIVIKPSSKDDVLIKFMVSTLSNINSEFNELISFKNNLKNCDAFIATGSDNSSRYFDYYFSKSPNIIRKNRSSLAILSGNESMEELKLLAKDIFLYYGLGCRNVSKLLIPKNYDLNTLSKAFYEYRDSIRNQKYFNNYNYNKARFLMNNNSFYDGRFFLLKEGNELSPPVSVISYENYTNFDYIEKKIEAKKNKIQCIVTNTPLNNQSTSLTKGIVKFGQAQQPELWDYADDIDTLSFLLNLNNL